MANPPGAAPANRRAAPRVRSNTLAAPRRTAPRRRRAPQRWELAVLPVRNTVVFPHLVTPLFIDRERSLRAVEQAMLGADRTILILAQKEADIERPAAADVYQVGTEAVVGRILKMPDGTTSILVQGQRRVRVLEVVQDEPYLLARITPLEEPVVIDESIEALMRAVLGMYDKVTKLSRSIPD